jgi:hypothetical protein
MIEPTTPRGKAMKKAWDEYEPEFMYDMDGDLHKNEDTLYHLDDVHETFVDGFIAGIKYASDRLLQEAEQHLMEDENETNET